MIKFGIFVEPANTFEYQVSDGDRQQYPELRYYNTIHYEAVSPDSKSYASFIWWNRNMGIIKTVKSFYHTRLRAQEFANDTGIWWDWDFAVMVPFSGNEYYTIVKKSFFPEDKTVPSWKNVASHIENIFSHGYKKVKKIEIRKYDYFDDTRSINTVVYETK